jgi:hypothetical protein
LLIKGLSRFAIQPDRLPRELQGLSISPGDHQ